MQLASTSTPRSANNSATCSYDNGYRRYQRTPKMITSPGCWRPLNGLFGVMGMDLYPTSLSVQKFATEPNSSPLRSGRNALRRSARYTAHGPSRQALDDSGDPSGTIT